MTVIVDVEDEGASAPARAPASRNLRHIPVSLLHDGALIALIAVCLFLAFQSDVFLTSNNILNILRQASVVGMITVGMTLVLISGQFDLSVGSVVGLSGVVTLWMQPHLGSGVAVVCALAAGAAVGLVNGLLITKLHINSFIATLGMLTTARGVVLVVTEGRSITATSDGLDVLGNGHVGPVPGPVIAFAVIAIISGVLLNRTIVGRYLIAIGGNREAARLAGVPTDRYTIGVLMYLSTIAAVAGVILAARLSSVQPNAGTGLELDVIAAAVIGGTSLYGGSGRISRSIVGALLLATLNNGFNLLNIPGQFQSLFQGIIIVTAVALYSARVRSQ